jgi:D-serine deaminase-like pyridoxal phosphate-dependent protein
MAKETLDQVTTPSLVLDLDVMDANIARMQAKAQALGVTLRPHAKTHKCVEVAERQRAAGATGLTVSTLYEAKVFADHGVDDITWAFPVILNRIPDAAKLAERITLRLVVDSAEAVDALEKSGTPFHVWLKTDCGYHRAGVDPHSGSAVDLARRLTNSRKLRFDGILTHSGHSYHVRGRGEACGIAEQERSVMVDFAERLRANGVTVPAVSVGSTPAMSAVEHLEGVNEARPGNYVFYDYTQAVIGSCGLRDVAVTVLSSVVSTQPATNHSVIDAGALSLSKDKGSEFAPRESMGEIFDDYRKGTLRADARVVSVSQEHGTVSGPLKVGTRVRVVPNHSCLTVAQFDEYVVVRSDEVVDRWKIWRGRD